jgi:hypothetical protein
MGFYIKLLYFDPHALNKGPETTNRKLNSWNSLCKFVAPSSTLTMHAMTLPYLCTKNSVVTEFTKVILTIPECVL